MKSYLFNKFTSFKSKFACILNFIFNQYNFTKVFVIFLVGLSSRALVNYIYDVNVISDFTNQISLIYYFLFSFFVVVIHETVQYFQFSIFPSFFITFISCIADKILYLYNNINHLNFKNINLLFSHFLSYYNSFSNKITLNASNDTKLPTKIDTKVPNNLTMFSDRDRIYNSGHSSPHNHSSSRYDTNNSRSHANRPSRHHSHSNTLNSGLNPKINTQNSLNNNSNSRTNTIPNLNDRNSTPTTSANNLVRNSRIRASNVVHNTT